MPDALLIKSSGFEGFDVPADYGWGTAIGQLQMTSVIAGHLTLFDPAPILSMVPALEQYLAGPAQG